MEFSTRWHRLLRAAAFGGGLAAGLGSAVFMFSNVAPVIVHWRIPGASRPIVEWSGSVSLWVVALLPLLAGLAAGYLYHLPARLHHLRQHLHHRHRVHELEHELRELRSSFDKLVALPDDRITAVPAVPADGVVLKLPEAAKHSEHGMVRERRQSPRPQVVTGEKHSPARPRSARPTAETSG